MLSLFAVSDEAAYGVGAGTVLGGLATLLGVILRYGRGQSILTSAQWKAYGESMAKKYEAAVIAQAVTDRDTNAKLIEQATTIGRLTAENTALRERLK